MIPFESNGIENSQNEIKESHEMAKNREGISQQQEIMRERIIIQALSQDAQARLANLAAVRPDRAKQVEDIVIRMAKTGQISQRLNDESFKNLLNRIPDHTRKEITVKFDRRRARIDSDESDEDDSNSNESD